MRNTLSQQCLFATIELNLNLKLLKFYILPLLILELNSSSSHDFLTIRSKQLLIVPFYDTWQIFVETKIHLNCRLY